MVGHESNLVLFFPKLIRIQSSETAQIHSNLLRLTAMDESLTQNVLCLAAPG